MTEQELAAIEAQFLDNGNVTRRLVAEVRELQKLVGKPWAEVKLDGPTLARISREGIEALQEKNRALDAELLAITVERDNLRKQAEDLRAERDHERDQKQMRHRAWLEGKAMLDAANEREQLQIGAANKLQAKVEQLYVLAEAMWQSKTLLEAHQHFVAWRDRDKPVPMCKDPLPGAEGRPA